jgi:catechol 2,3-dioxygenase-like lactoylglutathione lyase family enzyme
MELRVFRHLWGLEDESLAQSLPRIAAKGYAGVEAAPQEIADLDDLRAGAAANGLAVKPLVALFAPTPERQLAEYRELLELAASFDPDGVTVHSGRDAWPLEQAIDFYAQVVALEAELGMQGAHETHRGRPLFTPWDTAAIVTAVPELRLCCDFSHWAVVAERLLEDQAAAIELAASRAIHLHTRVGYDQGPQVPDPRAPEYADAVAAHERWWELVWEAQRAAGATVTTFTPEYGPAPYLHTLPHTNAPVVDLEAVCDWQGDRTREQFAAWKEH